jgi:5-methylcytosine-specific restriction endonuclease McrA
MDSIPQKLCPKCDTQKPTTAFNKDRKRPDGLAFSCRVCENARGRDYYARNREKVLARTSEYHQANPDVARKAKKKWKINHREQHLTSTRERSAAWRLVNRVKDRLASLRWAKENPDAYRTNQMNRRARMRGSEGTFTKQEWQEMKARYNYRCLRCGRGEPEIKLSIDHIVPIVLGGANDIANIQPLCRACNASKGAREIIDYRA